AVLDRLDKHIISLLAIACGHARESSCGGLVRHLTPANSWRDKHQVSDRYAVLRLQKGPPISVGPTKHHRQRMACSRGSAIREGQTHSFRQMRQGHECQAFLLAR